MKKASNSRDDIVRAAMDLFHCRGYNAVGVKEICAKAEVNKGSFYHFFPSKRDLALAVIDAQWERYRDNLLEPAFARDVQPTDRIRRLFTMTCEYQVAGRDENGQIRGCPFANLALELSTDVTIRRKCEEIFRRTASYFEGALVEYAPGPDVRSRAEQLFAYYQGVILVARTSNDPKLIESMVETALEIAKAAAVA